MANCDEHTCPLVLYLLACFGEIYGMRERKFQIHIHARIHSHGAVEQKDQTFLALFLGQQ